MDDKERRQQGAHYTSERDIMKVVRSLFLNELRAEFEVIRGDRSTRRKARLVEFHNKLSSLRFMDLPADAATSSSLDIANCGSLSWKCFANDTLTNLNAFST